jgi:phosphohistidine phosphatase
MDLYVIRHADAVPLGENGIDNDADRPLTATGNGQCSHLAEALLRQGVHLQQIITSPLLRSRQTTDGLLKKLTPAPEVQDCKHLAPGGSRRKLTRFLCGLSAQSVAIVGHAPDLDVYAAWLIGSRKAQLELAKGGLARIHFEKDPDKGAGVLTWLVTPQWCQ